MSGYKLLPNETQFTIPTPNPESSVFISCIYSKPIEENDNFTRRAAILMHGIGGHKNYCYHSKLARKLSNDEGMHVIRFDFRNCGDSSKTGKAGRTLQNDIEDINMVYNWLINQGLYVDTLIGHSRGVVDMFNYQLQNMNKFIPNLVACAGRFIGSGLPKSVKLKNPNYEIDGGHFIKGFQDGEYKDVWVPFEETKSIGDLFMSNVDKITKDTDTLCIYGLEEQTIPLPDAALYCNYLGDRNSLVLLPGANHSYKGLVKISDEEKLDFELKNGLHVDKNGFVDYNFEVSDIIFNWMSKNEMNRRFYIKNLKIHKFLNRWKDIQGCFNFRDIGGYKTNDVNSNRFVKFNKIFRSGTLSNLTDKGAKQLTDLGIVKIYDLRSDFELGFDQRCELENIEVIHINQKDSNTSKLMKHFTGATEKSSKTTASYDFLLCNTIPLYKCVFQNLRDFPNDTILIHCTCGKDRTGVFIMLLLLLCNVDILIIQQEYGLTYQGLEKVKPQLVQHFKNFSTSKSFQNKIMPKMVDIDNALALSDERLAGFLTTQNETILEIDHLIKTKYGGITRYLQDKLGLSVEDQQLIKENLTFVS